MSNLMAKGILAGDVGHGKARLAYRKGCAPVQAKAIGSNEIRNQVGGTGATSQGEQRSLFRPSVGTADAVRPMEVQQGRVVNCVATQDAKLDAGLRIYAVGYLQVGIDVWAGALDGDGAHLQDSAAHPSLHGGRAREGPCRFQP